MTGLSVRGLTLARPGSRAGALALEDISFSAPRGAITALLGGTGSGKTLLLSGIAGLVKPLRGAVLADGVDVTARRGARRGIGLLAPGSELAPGRTVAAILRAAAGRSQAADIPGLSAALGLAALEKTHARDLTHSQGLALLAAARLLAGGDVLLVDEAGAGLDDSAQTGLWQFLTFLAGGGRTIVVATRAPGIALQAAHLVLLHEGKVNQAGPPDLLYAEPRDQNAALLTGPANILTGTVRQKLPGGFIWSAGGSHFRQAAAPGAPIVPLAGEVTLCLRPEALRPGVPAGADVNRLPGTVLHLTGTGGGVTVAVQTALGILRAAMPADGPVRTGQAMELAWAQHAATILPPIVA